MKKTPWHHQLLSLWYTAFAGDLDALLFHKNHLEDRKGCHPIQFAAVMEGSHTAGPGAAGSCPGNPVLGLPGTVSKPVGGKHILRVWWAIK